jgi:hypothetical protein
MHKQMGTAGLALWAMAWQSLVYSMIWLSNLNIINIVTQSSKRIYILFQAYHLSYILKSYITLWYSKYKPFNCPRIMIGVIYKGDN